VREDGDTRDRSDALGRAYEELARLRQLLVDARTGASPEWIAAAESAILRAEREVLKAGGDPAEVGGSLSSADGRTDGVGLDPIDELSAEA
jgi:hypothetical protein